MFIKTLENFSFLTIEDIIGERISSFIKKNYRHRDHPIGSMSYFEYAYGVADILKMIGADSAVITAAVIYFLLPAFEKTFDEFEKELDYEVLNLVEEIHYLSKFEWHILPTGLESNKPLNRNKIMQKMFLLSIDEIQVGEQEEGSSKKKEFQGHEKQVENVIRMLLALTTDVRALVIMLAGRLYMTKKINVINLPHKEKDINNFAKINLIIYVPIANRLGIWRLKSLLEDSSFQIIQPDKYDLINKEFQKSVYKNSINYIIDLVKNDLKSFDKVIKIYGREKSVFSIYQKMEMKQLKLGDINDFLGIRIIVKAETDCYSTQDILHRNWQPMVKFYNGDLGRDWVMNPKENGYQSLHTTVLIEDKIVEFQIRTEKMHEIAEYGPSAAHWRYKEEKTTKEINRPKGKSQRWANQLSDLKQNLIETDNTLNPMYFMRERTYVITPQGHVVDLKVHAILLDFAYRIHTDLGHIYTKAEVDGDSVSFDYRLKNGDIVEVFKTSTKTAPDPSWLIKDRYYLFARTPQARRKVRTWFKTQPKV